MFFILFLMCNTSLTNLQRVRLRHIPDRSRFLPLQHPAQLFQSPFFNSGYIPPPLMETMPRTYFSGQLLSTSFCGHASPGNETGSVLRPKPICAQFFEDPYKSAEKGSEIPGFQSHYERIDLSNTIFLIKIFNFNQKGHCLTALSFP